jgi:hypothetical protein
VLAAQLCQTLGVTSRARRGELPLHLVRARKCFFQSIAETQLSLAVPYFCRKRSTRPAVSTSFCLPV